MSKPIIAVVRGRGPSFATQCFRQGSAGTGQYVNRHRGTGRPRGTWNTNRGWTQQPRAATNTTTTGSASQPFTKKILYRQQMRFQGMGRVSAIIASR